MTAFCRFPHTPHLAWLGPGRPRRDKLLAASAVREILAGTMVVEEKVDGANLGFSVDEHGTLRGQNRGSYLDRDALRGQWKPLASWLSARDKALAAALGPELVLFGEWCYAMHSVRYTRLPDWFLTFDVYDRAKGEFWSVERRDGLARQLGLAAVPQLGRGRFDLDGLKDLLGRSRVTDGPPEGVYVRREEGGRLLARAKLVRAEFVQGIDNHWSKRRVEANQLVRTAP